MINHGISPSLVSFDSTKLVILGGLQQDLTYCNFVTMVDYKTEGAIADELPELSPEELGLTYQDPIPFKDENGELMAFQIINSNEDGYRMSIIKEGSNEEGKPAFTR